MLRNLLIGTASALLSFVLTSAQGCGTDAVGVDECRRIESARCVAGQSCGIVADVESCQRFYRDHCLHGLWSTTEPGAPAVKACITSIQAAGKCGKRTKVEDCKGISAVEGAELETPCDAVLFPDRLRACEFLNVGSGGSGGAAGATP